MNDEYYMRMTLSLARATLSRGNYPCGCVIVKDGKIISKGMSEAVTKKDVIAHAETQALSRACRKLKSRVIKGCILYTSVEPCLMCGRAIAYSGIDRIIYGAYHNEHGKKRTFDVLKTLGFFKGAKISRMKSHESEKLIQIYYKK